MNNKNKKGQLGIIVGLFALSLLLVSTYFITQYYNRQKVQKQSNFEETSYFILDYKCAKDKVCKEPITIRKDSDGALICYDSSGFGWVCSVNTTQSEYESKTRNLMELK